MRAWGQATQVSRRSCAGPGAHADSWDDARGFDRIGRARKTLHKRRTKGRYRAAFPGAAGCGILEAVQSTWHFRISPVSPPSFDPAPSSQFNKKKQKEKLMKNIFVGNLNFGAT